LKKAIKKLFDLFGLQVIRKQPHIEKYTYYRNDLMIEGLKRVKLRGLEVNTIVDVGAAEGSWSLSATEFWPEANYVLFEPLEERNEVLKSLSLEHNNFHFVPAAAGRDEGEVSFHVSSDLDGSGVADGVKGVYNVRSVPVTSIEKEIKNLHLNGPYIIKLDTHGFEVPIIEGCSDILNNVSLFIIECYGFQIAKDSLLFWEMCRLLEQKGFRLIDIIDVVNRPKDKAFWQCDAFFAPADLDLFKDTSYL